MPYSTCVRGHGLDAILTGCILNHLKEHSFRNTHTFHPERWIIRCETSSLTCNQKRNCNLPCKVPQLPSAPDDATIVVSLSYQILHPTLRMTPSEEGHERSTLDGGTRPQRKRNDRGSHHWAPSRKSRRKTMKLGKEKNTRCKHTVQAAPEKYQHTGTTVPRQHATASGQVHQHKNMHSTTHHTASYFAENNFLHFYVSRMFRNRKIQRERAVKLF